MKHVKAIRGFGVGGKSIRAGDVVELDNSAALIVIGSGKAVACDAPKPKAAKKAAKKKSTRSD